MEDSVDRSSLIGDAILYTLNQEVYLRRYLEDGHLSIDNNSAERALKNFAVGRRNWLFAKSVRGADASALVYSITETALLNHLKPYAYLTYILDEFRKMGAFPKEEELKTGTLSNGTVQNYLGAITNIKKHPISERKLKNVTSEHLQAFFDLLSFGGTYPDGSERKGYSKDYIRSFSAVLQQSFRFAVSPKQYITFNPMQYIKLKYQTDEVDLFSDDDMDGDIQPIPREDYERLIEFLQDYNPPAILPIQIAYYAGLRIGEACGLAWHDVNLEEQCLTIRRSIRYDGSRHKNIIGPTKRKKVRIVDFGDTLAEILRNARKEQLKNRMQYGELYHKNYYREVKDKNRVYYEFYHLDGTENVPEDYKEISFVCLRPDGSLELPSTLGIVCRKIAQKLDGFEGFHFHQLRHTYTSNLLANGAAPKDVQELLGHSDVSTTMNVYAHSTRKAKRESAKLLDKVAGND